MKKVTTLVAGLLLVAAVAGAHEMYLNFNDCTGSGNGSKAMTLTCANATAPITLVASVNLSADIPNFNAAGIIVDFQTDGTTLPDWWNFAGTCRAGLATSSWNTAAGATCHSLWDIFFTASGNSPLVAEQWQLQGTNLAHGPNWIRYNGGAAIGTADLQPATDAAYSINEWGIAQLTIKFTKTTGLGACAGCATGVCAVLNEVDLGQLGNPDGIPITTGTGGNYCSFNTYSRGVCPGDTPAKNESWGKLKSLYR